MSERVCHTMQGVREASSFVPEIGTADTSDKRRSTECSHDVARAKNGSDLLNPCAGSFCNFCGQKVEKERLEIEYTTKAVRLKTA